MMDMMDMMENIGLRVEYAKEKPFVSFESWKKEKAAMPRKKVGAYRYEYRAEGSSVVCKDNMGHDSVQAMCLDSTTAQAFADILNDARRLSEFL